MLSSLLSLIAGFFKSFSSAHQPQTSRYQPKENDVPFEENFIVEEMLAEENDAYIPFYADTDDYDDYEAESDNAEVVECYEQDCDEAHEIDDTDDAYYY